MTDGAVGLAKNSDAEEAPCLIGKIYGLCNFVKIFKLLCTEYIINRHVNEFCIFGETLIL